MNIDEIIEYLELMNKNIDFSKLGFVYGNETLKATILKLKEKIYD